MPSGEVFGSGTDGEDGHSVRRMGAGGPTDVGFFIEKRDACFAEGVDGLVHIFRILALAGTGFLVERFQFLLLVVRDLHGVPEAEVLAVEAFHILPFGFGVLFEELREAVGEDPGGAFLVLEEIQMEGIIAVAERHSAGLMIGGDEDEGLVGVREIEIICHPHRLVHIPCLADGGSGIIGMAGIINHAPLDHHEEPLVAGVEERNGGGDDLRERQVTFLAVNGIREVGTMNHTGIAGLDHDEFIDGMSRGFAAE